MDVPAFSYKPLRCVPQPIPPCHLTWLMTASSSITSKSTRYARMRPSWIYLLELGCHAVGRTICALVLLLSLCSLSADPACSNRGPHRRSLIGPADINRSPNVPIPVYITATTLEKPTVLVKVKNLGSAFGSHRAPFAALATPSCYPRRGCLADFERAVD
jgi:hypothetical protein